MNPAEKLIIQACRQCRPKHIRSRDDLSFTIRDDEGGLINWVVCTSPSIGTKATALARSGLAR
jgi:hypothetical protein